ncbi:MAG TPA: 3-hydroxyisobutyrate dehydrogenase [Dongiaceae bacterium]|jgi:3-hydroxyisobutyrate dehydrogenase|nr:3-hydroxyisobutyrate dehydrogenase [Dongiaceae bacterium]
MATIGFIGLGNMGLPMARNLVKAGHRLRVFDVSPAAVEKAVAGGAEAAGGIPEAVQGAAVVITMLPAGQQVREVYMEPGRVIALAAPGTLLVDCSTIDVETARVVHARAAAAGLDLLDAPVSGGVAGAEAGTLTFMVGGAAPAFAAGEPLLAAMGKAVIHAGGPGNGQAAKICNNLILGVSMIAVCEAFALAERLGLPAQILFDISSKSSGQCWSLTSYCPVPGPVPASPANRGYRPGFAAAMMLKDLRLARTAAESVAGRIPLGQQAEALYAEFVGGGGGGVDFSGIISMLQGRAP